MQRTSSTVKKKKTTKSKIHPYLQAVRVRASAKCKLSAVSSGTSTAKRSRKTPHSSPMKCVGSVQVGEDGFVYIAALHRTKNPTYKTSSPGSGRGTHLTAKWKKLYNQKSNKPYKASDLPAWVLLQL